MCSERLSGTKCEKIFFYSFYLSRLIVLKFASRSRCSKVLALLIQGVCLESSICIVDFKCVIVVDRYNMLLRVPIHFERFIWFSVLVCFDCLFVSTFSEAISEH